MEGNTAEGELYHLKAMFVSNIIHRLLSDLLANCNLWTGFLRTLDVDLGVCKPVVQYTKDLLVHIDSNDHNRSTIGVTTNSGEEMVAPEFFINLINNVNSQKAKGYYAFVLWAYVPGRDIFPSLL